MVPTAKKDTATKKSGTSGDAQIRIRMYRVGFGDCFLITLGGTHHILVDCGVHNAGNITTKNVSLIQAAFNNIVEVTGKKLDVVIATHAHQDHVSGYGSFADQFRQFTIGEVWMPWTDDLSDATARKWHEKKKALMQIVRGHLALTPNAAAAAAVDNAEANPKAMEALRNCFGKGKDKVRYLKAGDKVDKPAGIEGLSVSILGPPQDQEFISKMNPPSSDHYLRMAAQALEEDASSPFPNWGLTEARMPKNWPRLKPKKIEELKKQAQFPAAATAFRLDKLLNNTSIVALFNWNGKQMLFPGDAQYGNWAYWYKKNGAEVLSNVCFYKVAHHGSLNATPKGALEEMPEGQFAAMASTQSKPWKSIPRPGLVAALAKRTHGAFARSDCLAIPGAPNCDAHVDAAFTTGDMSQGQYWIDYSIR
jgi:beta-lactamase superfamily II metal-dependent hydrolase